MIPHFWFWRTPEKWNYNNFRIFNKKLKNFVSGDIYRDTTKIVDIFENADNYIFFQNTFFTDKYGSCIFVWDFVTNELWTYEVSIFKWAFCFWKKRITEINSRNLSIIGNVNIRYV